MDFYIVCGEASSPSFDNNHSGDFKVLLSKEIDLNNVEYSVAVCSVGRYYETIEKDVVFIREKRDVPIPTPLPHPYAPYILHPQMLKRKKGKSRKNMMTT